MESINWLFLRGLTREKRHWGEFLSVFPQVNVGDKVLCLDLPGFGTETELKVPLSINAMAEELRSRWKMQKEREQFQPQTKWGLLGISLGGMIGLDWMAKNPDDFKMGVIINSSAGDLSPPYRRLKIERLPDLLKTRILRNPTDREEVILKMTTRMLGSLNDRAREWGAFYKERPYHQKSALRQLAAAISFISPKALRTPTLFLSSKNDALTDSSCTEKLAQKYNSPSWIHENAGHDLTLDDPLWVSHKILEYKNKYLSSL